LVVFYIPLVHKVANLHVVIDLSGWQLVGNTKKLRTSCELHCSWQLVGNPGCQSGLATSFQLVRLVGCGLYALVLHFQVLHFLSPHPLPGFWRVINSLLTYLLRTAELTGH